MQGSASVKEVIRIARGEITNDSAKLQDIELSQLPTMLYLVGSGGLEA